MRVNKPSQTPLLYKKFKESNYSPNVFGRFTTKEGVGRYSMSMIFFNFRESDSYNIKRMKEIEQTPGFGEWYLTGSDHKYIKL